MYKCKVLEYTRTPRGAWALTCEIRYPRQVLAEVRTHRLLAQTGGCVEWDDASMTDDFSKNSASSRAIPLWRMVEAVLIDPYVPERFSIAGPTMQAAGYMEGTAQRAMTEQWLLARDAAVVNALSMSDAATVAQCVEKVPALERLHGRVSPKVVGAHKQEVNRLLEPWAWMEQVVTGDGRCWNNFWALRCDKAAAPAFQRIARMTYLAWRSAEVRQLDYGEWHLPYVSTRFTWLPEYGAALPPLIRMSAARCAWVSYMNQGKEATQEDADRTFARLVGADPKHASPLEHQLTPMHGAHEAAYPGLISNVRGYVQARKLMKGERTELYSPTDEEVASWNL